MRLDGYSAQAGFRRQRDGSFPDCRPVGTTLLAGLFDLDEHPARAVAAERLAAAQQLVRSFDRLDPQYQPLLDDDRLADIEGTQRPGDLQPVLDIGVRLPVRADF